MNDGESFSNSSYVDESHLEEREFSAFFGAVTELFGPEQARASAEDWLEEADLMDSPPRSTDRDWRSVTIAASARLASRIDAARRRPKFLIAGSNAAIALPPSSLSFTSVVLV